jgi:hypothetical protein
MAGAVAVPDYRAAVTTGGDGIHSRVCPRSSVRGGLRPPPVVIVTPIGGNAGLPVHAGVWLPWPGKRLQASTTDLPVVRRAVAIGNVTVIRR